MEQHACGFDGCDRPYRKGGYCATHYMQMKRRGVEGMVPIGSVKTGPKKGTDLIDEPRYAGMHRRLRTRRGMARQHPCAVCGETANEWAYNKSAAQPLYDTDARSGLLMEYSKDVNDYDPLCRSCHRNMDKR